MDNRYQTYVRKTGTDKFVESNAFMTKKWAKDWVMNGFNKHDAGYVVDMLTHEIIYQRNAKEYIAKMI